MLAPRASSAFVCLRCELTLARPRHSALRRRAPHASFSSSSRLRDADDDEPDKVWRLKSQPLSEHPLGRLRRGKGGSALRETTARLEGTKTLGEDASIIVLEDLGGGQIKEHPPQPEVAQDYEQIPLKLAEALADEKPATLEEVVEQLDKLRQKATNDEFSADEGHYVSQAVYAKLSTHLLGAFTNPQLSHYYSQRKGVEKDRVAQEVREGLKQLQGKAKRPSQRSQWTPGTTQIDRRLPTLDVHSKKKRRAIGKHLLVDQILRDVWGLVMLEELEASGEIELALKDWQLAMLTSGVPETALDKIGQARKVRIEVDTADKVLRITADKHTAEYAADDVEHLLQASESHRFHFTTWLPHLQRLDGAEPTIDHVFSNDVLAVVASLTGAQLQRTTDKVIMRALDKETNLEAERCLIKLLPLKSQVLRTVDTTARDALERLDHFMPVVVEKEQVAYKARNSEFGRWSLPTKRTTTMLPASDSVAERVKNAQEHVLKIGLTAPVKHQRSNVKLRKWTHQPEVRLKAQYGHALFPLEGPTSERATTFIPALPGLSSFFNEEAFKMSFVTRPTLCYEFIAEPGPQNYTPDLLPYKFPRLSAHFRYIQGQQGLSKVVLNFGAGTHQVLLPEEAVDIQFTASQSIQMTNARINPYSRALQDHVLQNLQSGGRLTAPNIEMDIPKWTVEGMEFDTKEDVVTTRFQFIGVTFTQSVWGEHHGNPATYSTKQSGKLGATNGVFSTVYGVNRLAKPIAAQDPPNAMREFVANAFKTARTITEAAAASQAGMKKIERKPKQRQSSDSHARRDEGDLSRGTHQSDSIKQPVSNDFKTTAQPSDTFEASFGAQTNEYALKDLQLSRMLNDTASPDGHDEKRLSTSQEEFTEEEQKRRLESTA